MDELIVFPDIEAAVITRLSADLLDMGRTTPVYGSIPATRPAEFVTVQRIGGPRKSLVVDSPSLMFDCYAGTTSAACSLASLVRAVFHSWRGSYVETALIYATGEFAGPQFLPDPRTTQARYRFTATLDVRGTTTAAPSGTF